jgi:novobiocin biosynthesis protein NovU/D-mycarose 3-C-methyltransferase
MYRLHTKCRACGNEKLVNAFDLGLQPLANNFAGPNDTHAGFAPLKVLFCPECLLGQLSVVVDPAVLYANYAYVTSPSATMVHHFEKLWQSGIQGASNVMEIGSNDGRLLSFLKSKGVESVLGIDPAENLTAEANAQGVRSICGLFNENTAHIAAGAMPLVDIAYVMDMLNEVQFDTIYHEHLSYLSIKSIVALLEHTPFRLQHVQHFTIHGGAVALYLRRRDFESVDDDSVSTYLNNESRLLNMGAWDRFKYKAKANIRDLKTFVEILKSEGNKVCGFGASAKSTVWINACEFNRNHLQFITDTTPQKQGKLSPGVDIPVVDEGALLREQPDFAVLFAWNYLDFVISQNQPYIAQGGRFIVPVPRIRTVPE